jgi:hypothetical protein
VKDPIEISTATFTIKVSNKNPTEKMPHVTSHSVRVGAYS